MIVADLIVEFLISKNVKHIFGYPGGMVTTLIHSLDKYKHKITNHINYNEQGSSFCACGYALASKNIGVAYATSGPGVSNLITGICNSYFDSIPVLFITINVNINESKKKLKVRQLGFQEMNVIDLVKNYSKYSKYISDKNEILFEFQKAFFIATNNRPGAVVLDIPMNVLIENIEVLNLAKFYPFDTKKKLDLNLVFDLLNTCVRPCMIIGLGAKKYKNILIKLLNYLKIPVVLSMPNIDLLPSDYEFNFGFLGAYGNRSANFIIHKADLIISLGSRLDIRQIGAIKQNFAPNAKLVRVDIDKFELENKIKENELGINCDCGDFIKEINNNISNFKQDFYNWYLICSEIKDKLSNIDDSYELKIIREISKNIEDEVIITTDVGQNQVWIAQGFIVKNNQRILFSSSFGAMGCSLPMAIGAYFSGNKIYCISGDGGFQMNIQELEFINRENLNIVIIIINNKSLGMIRQFEDMYFDSHHLKTTIDTGYSSPDFNKIAFAYNLDYKQITCIDDIKQAMSIKRGIIEVVFDFDTKILPKLEYKQPNCNQFPYLDDSLYNYLLNL